MTLMSQINSRMSELTTKLSTWLLVTAVTNTPSKESVTNAAYARTLISAVHARSACNTLTPSLRSVTQVKFLQLWSQSFQLKNHNSLKREREVTDTEVAMAAASEEVVAADITVTVLGETVSILAPKPG